MKRSKIRQLLEAQVVNHGQLCELHAGRALLRDPHTSDFQERMFYRASVQFCTYHALKAFELSARAAVA